MGYPRSFLGLLLAGFTLVALPLVGALAYSAWNTERLAEQSRNAVYSASQAARASRSLVNRIGSIERIAQQMALVNDPDLAADYARVRHSFKQVSDELMLLPLDQQQLVALKKTVAQEEGLYALLSAQPRRKLDARRVGRLAGELAENAYEVLAISYLIADREVLRLRHNAESVQRQLILLVIFSTAVVLTMALALTRYISRPIAELDASIRQLGGADFSRAITVRGPEDLQSLGERLDWLRRRLAELEAEKNRFLRHLSHELKTPLTALREGSDLLSSGVVGNLNAEQHEIARILRENSIELRKLIEGLLNYSAVHAQTSYLDASIVQLRDVVKRVVNDRKLAIVAKNLRVDLNCEIVTAYCDEEKIRVVLDNLLSNAVKYSPEKGVVAIKLYKERSDAVIEVIDEGPGIAPAEREKIFEAFYRDANAPPAAIKGSGLGLSIVKEYVQLHKGVVEVLDGPGGRFRIRFPRKQADGAEEAA